MGNMKKLFKEYHQFTDQEFQQLWKDCLFVFDTNTLLNMYRYSRATVDTYFDVLNELKKKKQLWVPYQVGYEFYENRINVISEYEKSYDQILSILKKAKEDIEDKYKNHPFLDLCKIKEEINEGVSGVENKIKKAKEEHPKWLEKDEVLEKLNKLFEGNIGDNYEEQRLNEIIKEGKERYEKKIPPGFKDDKKNESKKYGDLFLWYQIIDKAKKSKKPIVLISGDIKEDWWVEKDGKSLMPLPQLKREIHEKAGVDFHIYTADRFLELNKTNKKHIDDSTIKEVREIRKLEETRMMMKRREMIGRDKELDTRRFERYSIEYINLFEIFEGLMKEINELEIYQRYKEELADIFRKIRELRNKILHGGVSRIMYGLIPFHKLYGFSNQTSSIFYKIINSEEIEIHPELSIKLREFIDRLEHLNQKFRRNL